MLTDAALRNLTPKSKIYKASDRDGVYVTVSTSGTITFRYDYRLNGRCENAVGVDRTASRRRALGHGRARPRGRQGTRGALQTVEQGHACGSHRVAARAVACNRSACVPKCAWRLAQLAWGAHLLVKHVAAAGEWYEVYLALLKQYRGSAYVLAIRGSSFTEQKIARHMLFGAVTALQFETAGRRAPAAG